MSDTATAAQTMNFQAEVKQLLHLMIHSLYSNRDIFLRELVSNASDACDKLRFESIADPALLENDSDLKIRVAFDKEARTITITDNGIGMSRDEAISHLGTIARSGTKEFFSSLDPLFRSYGKTEAKDHIRSYFEADKEIEAGWLDYNARFKAQSQFIKHAAFPFGDPESVKHGGGTSDGQSEPAWTSRNQRESLTNSSHSRRNCKQIPTTGACAEAASASIMNYTLAM